MLKAIMRTLVVGALFVLVAGTGADRANAQTLSPQQMNALQAAVAADDMAAIQSLTAQIVESDPMLHEAVGAALGGFVGSVPGAAENAEAIAEAMSKGVVQGSAATGASSTEIGSRVRDAVYAMVNAAPPQQAIAIAAGAVAGAISGAQALGLDENTIAAGAVAGAIDAGASPQAVAFAALLAGADPDAVVQGLAAAGVPNPESVVDYAQNLIDNNRRIGNENEGDTSAT